MYLNLSKERGEPLYHSLIRGIEVFGNYEAPPLTMVSLQPHPQNLVTKGRGFRIIK